MATAYSASNLANQLRISSDANDFSQVFQFTVPTAGFIINDTVKLCKIPGNARNGVILLDILLNVPDLDTATGVTLDLGDGGSATRYLSASTTGQAAGTLTSGSMITASIPHLYTADDYLILTIHAAPTTSATTGLFTGYCRFNVASFGDLT